jgi:predicted nucleotidyltransferase
MAGDCQKRQTTSVSPAPKHLWHHVLMVPVTNAPAVPSAEAIAAFCRKWQIVEFSLFGSILRGDFSPGSDVDILVDLAPDAPWSLYEWTEMIEELRDLFGRDIDLVEKSGLRNPFRRHEILNNREILYAA